MVVGSFRAALRLLPLVQMTLVQMTMEDRYLVPFIRTLNPRDILADLDRRKYHFGRNETVFVQLVPDMSMWVAVRSRLNAEASSVYAT